MAKYNPNEENEYIEDKCFDSFLKTDLRRVSADEVLDDKDHFYTVNIGTFLPREGKRPYRKVDEMSFDVRGDELLDYVGSLDSKVIDSPIKTTYEGEDAVQLISITEYKRTPVLEDELAKTFNKLYAGYRDNPFKNSHQSEHFDEKNIK